jgi:hypothetical protein
MNYTIHNYIVIVKAQGRFYAKKCRFRISVKTEVRRNEEILKWDGSPFYRIILTLDSLSGEPTSLDVRFIVRESRWITTAAPSKPRSSSNLGS